MAAKAKAATAKKATAKKATAKKAPAKKKVNAKTLAAAESESTESSAVEAPGTSGISMDGKKRPNATLELLSVKQISEVKDFNPRQVLGDLDALEATIKKDGLLHPITVAPGTKDGTYEIVSGHRRMAVMKRLQRTEVPVLVRTDLALTGDKEKDAEVMATRRALSVAENSDDARHGLNDIEIGRVFTQMAESGWSVKRISSECGVHDQKVRRTLKLMEAPDDVKARVESGELSSRAALEIAKLDDGVREAIKNELHSGTSANEVKALAKQAAKQSGATSSGKLPNHAKGAARDASVFAWKGSKAKSQAIIDLCHILDCAKEDEKESADYHQICGAVAWALWDRGELVDPYIVPGNVDPDSKEGKAAVKSFFAEVKKWAARHVPETSGVEEEA